MRNECSFRKLVTSPGYRVSFRGFSTDSISLLQGDKSPVSMSISGEVSVSLANVISKFKIQELELNQCGISTENLTNSVSQQSVKKLTIRGMTLRESLFQSLNERLQILCTSGCEVELKGVGFLSRLSGIEELSFCLASFSGIVESATLLESVRVVDFSGSNLTDEMMSSFKFGDKLEKLSLLGTQVSEGAFMILQEKYSTAELWFGDL